MASFEEATSKFVEWLEHEKVTISPSVAIKDLRSQNQGRGLVAVEDIKEDEELFVIPRDIIINIDNCSLLEKNPDIMPKLLTLNHWESLIIIILYELKVAKENSKWVDYFNVLPIIDEENYKFNQLMFWSDKELEKLKPSLILDRIGKELAEDMYNKLFPKVTVDQLGIQELNDVTIEDYHKAASLIMSYSFDVQRQGFNEDGEIEVDDDDFSNDDECTTILKDGYFKSMVPLADTLNANTNLHNAILIYSPTALVMKSIKPIKKGEQIYNTYSDHPNSEILRRYGYIELQGSKYEFGEVPLYLIKNFFIDDGQLSESFIEEIFKILNEIVAIEEEEELVEIVLDSYDCFKNSEVILELIFIIQILTIISSINSIDSMEQLTYDSKFLLINRIFKKCYKLIKSRRLSNAFISNYEKIINLRLNEYPKVAKESFESNIEFNRTNLAEVVLKSEYQSLKNCLNIKKTFTTDNGKYKFIDDDKLIRNIIKKRFNEDTPCEEESASKKLKAD